MRAVIIGGGCINDYDYIKSKINDTDFIICADSGYDHAKKLGIEPDIVIGDMDSVQNPIKNTKKIVYPARKDFTDGELAVRYATDNGYEDIALIAMTGDRMDHTLCGIFLLQMTKNGVLIDDNNEIYLLRGKLTISGERGQTVSIIPLTDKLCSIVTEGLEYPLSGETLSFSESRGVSNVMTDNKCTISAKEGMALVIKVRRV